MSNKRIELFILFSLSLCHLTETKWVQGILQALSDWEFLTRFCFLTEKGTLYYEFKYPVDFGPQNLLLYYDTPGQWDAVYKRGKNCTQSVSVLSVENNQIIALTNGNDRTSQYSGCSVVTLNGKPWYQCSGQRSFISSRERWWYMAVSRCSKSSQTDGLYLEYKLHMTNGYDLLHKEYSADEFYIFPVDVTFFLIYVLMCILSVVCAISLRNRQLFHTTYKLYLVSLFIWTFHLFLMVIAWGHYGTTGWEIRPVEVTGRILRSISMIIFILMLILMAKGYTITRGRLTRTSTIRITVFLNLYIIIIVILFVWEGMLFDPGKVLYYYESPPGYGLVTMHLIGWLWFLYATVFTLKHTTKRINFYIPFFAFYTLWFWAAPIMTLIAMFSMAKWSREKTVNAVEQFIAFWGHVFFLVLTRPSAANKNFPYHVRTSQIGTLPASEDEKKKKNNPYVVSSGYAFSEVGTNLNFFITSRGEGHAEGSNKQPLVQVKAGDALVKEDLQIQKETLPIIHGGGSDVAPDVGNNINNNNSSSTGAGALSFSYNSGVSPRATTLPPIRGIYLPPLIPSAPLAGTEPGNPNMFNFKSFF
ncbi:transmembrane protein 145-like [Physella acuta]|uniref:transmembrane protein 145-like n=1 Tax=Physella acuta TaxID=109671 RepID=UPI0027DE7A3B|nr:transmembrane protein 145-like [Physella acuta]